MDLSNKARFENEVLSVLGRLIAVRVNVFGWRDRVNWLDTIQNIVRL